VSWKIGLSTGACIDRPIADVLKAFRDVGARGVELGTHPRHFDVTRPDEVAGVAACLRSLALQPISIHAPFGGSLDLAHPDAAHRTAAVNAIKGAADAVKHAGGTIVVVHPSDLARHGQDVNARVNDTVASLTSVGEFCRQRSLTLAVESPLPHLIGGNPDEFRTILSRLDPAVKVCLDTGHTFLGGFWNQFVDVSSGRLEHVHASDNLGVYDDHLPPGEGRIDWKHVVATLERASFAGWVMLELHCLSNDVTGYFAKAMQSADVLRPRA
jgi:sugar phosphate isomerase/epimerase